MHPAVSVIFFTVASGAGIRSDLPSWSGLPGGWRGRSGVLDLACRRWSGRRRPVCPRPFISVIPSGPGGRSASGVRAGYRGKGICAIATIVLFGIYSLSWMVNRRTAWPSRPCHFDVGAAATVFTTSMIYAQLKTVPQWQSALTPAGLSRLRAGLGLAACLGPSAAFDPPSPGASCWSGWPGARSGCGGLGRPGRGSRMPDRRRKLPPGWVSSARCGFSKSRTAATTT
jgi:hypothetical protein